MRRLALAAACAVASACHASSGAPSAGAAAVDAQGPVAVEPPVPAPDGLLAEAYLAAPTDFWKKAQAGIGGAAALMPDTFAGVVFALAGADDALAREVDAAAPAFAALGESDGAPAFAIAMKLTDAARTSAALFDGDAAPFSAKDVAGMRALTRSGASPSSVAAIAPGGYLVVASSEAELARLGPYAVRTMPTRPRPASAIEITVPHAAFAGPIDARAKRASADAKRWLLDRDADERHKHGGRAPDFADAAGIVDCLGAMVDRREAAVADLASATVDVDALDDALSLEITLHPSAGDGPASQLLAAMHPGDAAPLLDSSGDALLAWLFRDDAAGRASDAADMASCVASALGKRLGDDDAKRLRAAFDGWAKGRGDWVTGSVRAADGGSLVLHAPTADATTLAASLDSFGALAKRPFVADPLAKAFSADHPSIATSDAPPLGKATVLSFSRSPPDAAKLPPGAKLPAMQPVGAAWTVGANDTFIAVGESPLARLVAGAHPASKPDARAAKAITALGPNVVFALVARSLGAPAGPPLVFGWGARGGAGWARLELGYPLARDVVRTFVGL